MVTSNVSFYGQALAQSNRLNGLNNVMADLQRQLTTQKKSETFAGLGSDAGKVLRYRLDKSQIDAYKGNLDIIDGRLQLMTRGFEQTISTGRDVLTSIKTKIGAEDYDAINKISTQALPLLRDIANLDIDGRYLYAGSNTQARPLADNSTVNSVSSNLWAQFKNGTLTAAQVVTQLNSLTPAQLGFDPSLSSSGPVSARITDSTDLDYTSVASKNGMQDIYLVTSMLSQLTELNPAVDVPTEDDLQTVLNGLTDILQRGLDSVESQSADFGTKYNLLDTIQTNNSKDAALLDKLIDSRENVDVTEVSVKIQSLQTQLTASYQVTGILSQLSLVNYLR